MLYRRAAADWCLLEDLLDALATADENFLFPDRVGVERQRRQYYYYGNRFSGTPAQLLEIFTAAEQRFVRTAISDLLLPLGLVDVGFAAPEAPQWTATLGKQVLTTLEEPNATRILADAPITYAVDDQVGGRLIIQPNFQLLVIGPVALATLAKLDLFAERRKADLTVFEYYLSRESVYQGQQAGLHIDEIITFLQRTGGAPLPQNLERSLHEWGAYHKRIVFRRGVMLLQAADEQTLTDLLVTEMAVGEQVARVVAPGVALVRKGAEQPLLRALLASDRLPAISTDQADSADQSIEIDKRGRIRPIHSVPSLHLRGRLARFAEENDQDQWQLTAATVRRAGGSRKKVLALLDELGKLQRGNLPAEVVALVKQWGGYYGEVGAATVTLLEFRDGQALQELMVQPELQALLPPFPAGQRALALVAAKQLPTVKRILQTLGISVKEGLLD